MRKTLILIIVFQTLITTVFAEENKHPANTEVEDLAPPSNTPVSYFWSKEISSAKKSVISIKKSTINTGDITGYLMTPHTNPVNVMSHINTTPIFWGTSWYNPRYYSDKIFGLMHFYQNFQGSTYASIIDEYLPTGLSHQSASSIIDTSTASANPSNVLAKICSVVNSSINSKSDYYPVYTDIKRGTANYCAYHSAGICNGVPVQFAFFFDLNDDFGCDPSSPYAPPIRTMKSQTPGAVAGIPSMYQQSQGLAALANVTAHELFEAVTDPGYFPSNGSSPYWGGWFDSFYDEVADKCSWTFGPSNTGLSPGTVLIGGYYWKLQGIWSNEAQITGTGGYPTQNGNLVGCVTGS